jgi:hypothetical protein
VRDPITQIVVRKGETVALMLRRDKIRALPDTQRVFVIIYIMRSTYVRAI